MTMIDTELERARAHTTTVERTLAACLQIMTEDQIDELRTRARFLDNLGGISDGGG